MQLTEKITYGANTATPFIRTLNRAQDNLLRASSITLMAGTTTEHQINYGFDTAGRLSTITAADPNGGAAKVHTYGYLANSGNLIETITSPAHKVVNTYEADRNGLLSKQNSKLDNTLIGSYQYAMNSLGQRTSITKNGLAYPAATVETVGYDSKGQVVKTTDDTTATNNRLYTFDAIGNRLTSNGNGISTSLVNNSVNEITAITTTPDNESPITANFVSDNDGNMLTGTLPEDANGATLIWDAQNRLTKITKSDNTVIEYSYDYQSRRISKTIGTTKTTWIYNAWNPIAEYSNTTLTKTLTWGQDINGGIQSGGGVGGLLQETHHYPPLNSHYYPLYDGNGNITDYINTASAVLAHYQYDAFGNTIVKTGFKANDFAHRFSTKQRDTETGLYYYGYRYYDPVTGRWPSRDPIEESGGINLYAFVGNDGVNKWDVMGAAAFQILVDTFKSANSNNFVEYERSDFPLSWKDSIKSMKRRLESIQENVTDEEFANLSNAGQITIDNKIWRGSRDEFIKIVEHELTSKRIMQENGTVADLIKKILEIGALATEPTDQFVYSIHGSITSAGVITGNLNFLGEQLNQKETLKKIADGIGAVNNVVCASCYKDGKHAEIVRWNDGSLGVHCLAALTDKQASNSKDYAVKYRERLKNDPYIKLKRFSVTNEIEK